MKKKLGSKVATENGRISRQIPRTVLKPAISEMQAVAAGEVVLQEGGQRWTTQTVGGLMMAATRRALHSFQIRLKEVVPNPASQTQLLAVDMATHLQRALPPGATRATDWRQRNPMSLPLDVENA